MRSVLMCLLYSLVISARRFSIHSRSFVKGEVWRMYPHSGFWYRRSVFCTLAGFWGPGNQGELQVTDLS